MAQTQQFCALAIGGSRPSPFKLRPELRDIKLVGIEEHLALPDVFNGVSLDNHATRTCEAGMRKLPDPYAGERVADIAKKRLQDMDDNGMAMQILGLTATINTTHLLGDMASKGVALATDINNELKRVVDENPTRFKAFADLAMQVPEEAVKELRRCVTELGFVGAMLTGSVGGDGKFLDAPQFDPILSAFEDLDVPLFLHPGVPVKAVWDIYYDIPSRPDLSTRFGMGGWGWHNEVAIHVMRLVLTGTLDRHPRLKIIIGHQGEMLPAMMQRIEDLFEPTSMGLKRSVGETLRSQVWIAISGLFSLAPTQTSIANWGVDRVLFAVDYPYVDMGRVPEYIRALGELVSPADLRKICQTNAEDLLKIKA